MSLSEVLKMGYTKGALEELKIQQNAKKGVLLR
jgi:hypothetical protein